MFNNRTAEVEVIFPRKQDENSESYFETSFLTSSIFGFHTPIQGLPSTDYTWFTASEGAPGTIDFGFQVYAVRPSKESKDAYFLIRDTEGIEIATSSVYQNIYDDTKWNLAIRTGQSGDDNNFVSGSTSVYGNRDVELYGCNVELGIVKEQFTISLSNRGTKTPRRYYIGAHRQNFTGSVLQYSDLKISSLRHWETYLTDSEIIFHAKDVENHGVERPFESAYLYDTSLMGSKIPRSETLSLDWNFEDITGSDSNGEFLVNDFSSGSVAKATRYPTAFGHSVGSQYTGRGYGFENHSTGTVSVEYIQSSKQSLPEVVTSDDMTYIVNFDDEVFERDSRTINHVFAIEKSMYQTISSEMMNMFSTISSFNNLIGEPVNKYRQDYKDISKLRQLFYENVENEPDLDKFVDFYKWIDSSISIILKQFVPASTNISEDVRTMVESHVLERNKYQYKYPTLDVNRTNTLGGINGINTFQKELPNWTYAFAPISMNESDNTVWWQVAEPYNTTLSQSDAGVNQTRQAIVKSKRNDIKRLDTTPYKISVNIDQINETTKTSVNKKEVHGGINYSSNKNQKFYKTLTRFSSSAGVTLGNIRAGMGYFINDILNPSEKEYALVDEQTTGVKGSIVSPANVLLGSGSGYNSSFTGLAVDGIQLVNLHSDSYLKGGETPIQTIFTEKNVGGYLHRHASINTGTDTTINRAEDWKFTSGSTLTFSHPDPLNPRDFVARDGTAKRPLNIKNILSNAGNVLGNYTNIREVVSVTGREGNNKQFVVNEGFSSSDTPSTSISGVMDRPAIQFSSSNHTISERFSSPGGVETSYNFCDTETGQYSPYNALPYRNLIVRMPLASFLKNSTSQFGYAPNVSANTSDYSGVANFHKTNRNTLKRIQYSGSTLVTASIRDNDFVTHAIPRSDLQYSWITESYTSTFTLGYTPANFEYSNSSGVLDAITFKMQGDISSSVGVVQDFAGINNLVKDDINIEEQILGDSSDISDYVLSSYGTYTAAYGLNNLLSHRGDTFGFNTWNQIRGGNSPIVKKLNQNNIMSILYEDGQTYDANGNVLPSQRYGAKKQFRESPVIMKYKPIIQSIGTLRYISSYANNKSYFSNKEINDNFSPDSSPQIYDNIKSLYDNLNYVRYSETIYPAEQNVFGNKIRTRPDYSINFWNSDRTIRNDRKAIKIGFGDKSIFSIWGLDAPSAFLTNAIPNASTDLNDPPGELLNNKSQVHNTSYKSYITASALYSLPHMVASSASVVGGTGIDIPETGSVASTSPNIFGNIEIGAGNALWEAGRLAGRVEDQQFVPSSQNRNKPAYDTYGEYAEELRAHNKDYSVIPEFRISDHIDFYVKRNDSDFLTANRDAISIFGSSGSAQNPTDSSYDDFYNVYSNSDFLKYFDIIKSEHKNIASEKSLTLKCKALMKFMPYDGFYPSERTLQMAKQFSSSYAKYVNYSGSDSTYENAKIRPFLEPLFAPGIVYNSIKSGIGVAYPVLTSSYTVQQLGNYYSINTSSGQSAFEFLPFETAIEPNKYLINKSLVDLQPHPSAALDLTASWDGRGDMLYTMMANNFFGEVPEFFLPEGKITSIQSLPESDPNFGNIVQNSKNTNAYGMRVKVFRTLSGSRVSPETYEIPQDNVSQPELKETMTMYSRPSAFFHSVTGRSALAQAQNDSTTYADRVMDSISGYNWAGTPAYYHGESWVDFVFRPSTTSKYTIQEITKEFISIASRRFDSSSVSENTAGFYKDSNLHGVRYSSGSGTDTVFVLARKNAMDILDSFIIDGASTVKSVEYDAVTGAPLIVKDDPLAKQKVLVIQPKWETPMFDFGDTGVRPITSASNSLTIPLHGSESVPRGMWHQFGLPPESPDKGIFFQVTNIPKDWASKHPDNDFYNNGNLLSLADAMGIDTTPKRLGNVSEKKVISEAIIAVPFISDGNHKRFFDVDKNLFQEALNNKLEKTNSIQQMVSKLKKYVLPPRMDFITNKKINPFSMYVFEFEHEFDRDDLTHIWQNLPPKSIERVEQKEVEVSHPLLVNELLGADHLPSELRWMIFKVKMKAVKNYYSKVPKAGSKLEDQKYVFEFDVAGEKQKLKYSYNWPYDFFSIVEMAKIDAEVNFVGESK